MRSDIPVSVRERIDGHLKSGRFESESDVLDAAFSALDREEHRLDDELRKGIQAAYENPRPSVPAEDVFERLRLKHLARIQAPEVGS